MSETAEQPVNEQAVVDVPSPPKPKKKRVKRPAGAGSYYQRPDGLWMGRVSLGKNQDGTPNRKSLYGHTLWDVQEKCAIAMREYQESRIRASESTASATGVSISGQQSHGMVITSTGAMTIRLNGGMVIAVDAGTSVNVSNPHAQ